MSEEEEDESGQRWFVQPYLMLGAQGESCVVVVNGPFCLRMSEPQLSQRYSKPVHLAEAV